MCRRCLLKAIDRDPFSGEGKPKQLKGSFGGE
ncbi:MAG: type II toxin-antitoxin system YoeB family toxin [Lachnospiraceae bacterium]|nr:type II toxin-antitoxin system YoeB family toxin [Lachnospiraceae bacterium]